MKFKRMFALILSSVMVLSLLTACGGKKEEKNVDLSELWTSMEESLQEGDHLPALMELDDDTVQNLLGIDPADLDSYVARIPMMMVHATEFFIAKVKDGKMDTVKTALESRQAALDEQWSMYLPEQYELVQNYKLVTNGNYVLFCVCEDTESVVKLFNDATA
ncbi:MAG: DUF4358 domain-containing protein [Oscillospiraceae bacterium]|nr:DUF4358 domain-containing protein [Oscillospiraceae bacterium]